MNRSLHRIVTATQLPVDIRIQEVRTLQVRTAQKLKELRNGLENNTDLEASFRSAMEHDIALHEKTMSQIVAALSALNLERDAEQIFMLIDFQ